MQKIIADFSAYLVSRDHSPNTVSGYCRDLTRFIGWIGPHCEVSDVTAENIRAYRDQKLEDGASPNTVNRHLASLSAFGHWASTKAGLLAENPTLYVDTIEMVNLAPRWLNPDQRRDLLNTLRADLRQAREKYPRLWVVRLRNTVMVELLLHSGMRVSELCALRLSDLSLGERKGSLVVRSGKGRKQRSVPLQADIRKRLEDWLKIRPQSVSDRLFVGLHGEAITSRTVQRVVAHYAHESGIENLTPHSLRHSYARALLDSGASLVQVAALLGHKGVNTTARYVQPAASELEILVERSKIA